MHGTMYIKFIKIYIKIYINVNFNIVFFLRQLTSASVGE